MEVKPIPGAPGYFILSNGIVIGPGRRGDAKQLKPSIDRHTGHYKVSVPINGRRVASVGRLMALAFHGQPPTPKHEAAHRDGNPANNVPENIYWATRKENQADRKRHGWVHPGSRWKKRDQW